MRIEPYVHRCVIQSGDMAGSKNWIKVAPYDVEYAIECSECGEILAQPDAIIAHIYAQLLEAE